MKARPLPLFKGTLELLVLKALSWGDMHGYGISVWLDERSGGGLSVDDSALYQALHRLEAKRQVTAEWGVTDNGRRARFYRMTVAGRRELSEESETWRRYTATVGSILALNGPGG